MKTRTRNATVVAGIAVLLAMASGGTIAAQGQAKQQLISGDAVIRVSATSPDHHARGEHRTTHRNQNRSAHETAGQNRTVEIEAEQDTSVQRRTPEVGVAAAADAEAHGRAATQSPQGTGLEVVLKSLPGLDSDGESCS